VALSYPKISNYKTARAFAVNMISEPQDVVWLDIPMPSMKLLLVVIIRVGRIPFLLIMMDD